MASGTITKNNVIAGIFVLAGIALAIGISIVVSGAEQWVARRTTYYVRFDLAGGTYGLKDGSAVTLAGQPVGRVTAVDFYRPGGAGTAPAGVDVRVEIDSELKLFEDAWAFLERPLLGNLSSINIANIGEGKVEQPQNGDPALQAGEVLAGSMAPPAFLAQAGYGPDQARQFKLMIGQASEAVERINRITERVEAEVDPTLAGLRTAIEDVNSVTRDVREKTPNWTAKVDSVLAQAEATAGRFDPLAQQLSDAITQADGVMTDLREAIEANRPTLDRIMANIDQATERINRESVERLNAALQSAEAGADEFASAARNFNGALQEHLPSIRRILANLRLAADQIKLTGTEVRRNPWRLLYQPKTKELESELFYDAARTYAEAVSDLRAASESLESLAQTSNPAAVDEKLASDLNNRLLESFSRYRQAEQRLLEQMIDKRP